MHLLRYLGQHLTSMQHLAYKLSTIFLISKDVRTSSDRHLADRPSWRRRIPCRRTSWEHLADRTPCRLDTLPTGHLADWTPCRLDTLPTGHLAKGHLADWTPCRQDTLPTGHLADWTPCRLDALPTGHLSDWTPFRLDTFPTNYGLYKRLRKVFQKKG